MRRFGLGVSLALAVAATAAGCGGSKSLSGGGPTLTGDAPVSSAGSRAIVAGFETVGMRMLNGSGVYATLPRRAYYFTPAGHTYYVSNSGSDGAAGSLTAPWATVTKAISVAQPGDCIYLRAGTYTPFTISKSGVAGKPIIISSYPGELGRIAQPTGWQAANPHSATVTLSACNYVWIHGLYISGCKGQSNVPAPDGSGQNGISITNGGGAGVRIMNNYVTRAQHCGIKEMSSGAAGYILEGNAVYENGMKNANDHGIYVPSQNAIVRGNAIFRNTTYGIHLVPSPTTCSAYDNIIFDNGACGVIISGASNSVSNNVVTRNGEGGVLLYLSSCKTNTFLNNISYNNKVAQFLMDSGGSTSTSSYPSGNTIDYNGVWPNPWAVSPVTSWAGGHMVVADPKVVDATNNNYQLQSTSPCLGKAGAITLANAQSPHDIGIFAATAYTDTDPSFSLTATTSTSTGSTSTGSTSTGSTSTGSTSTTDPTPTPTPTATGGFATVTVKTISGASVTVTLPRRTFNFTTAGHTYYVSNSGSDSAAGTLSAPWATIPKALNAAVAGDIIYVRAGTYPPFTISKSGVAGKPIILSSYPGEQARIIQPNGWQLANPHSPTVLMSACTYVWLHGFYIEGCMGQSNIPPRDEYGQNGVELANGAGMGCYIVNNTITRAQHCGVKEMHHGGTQYVVEGNVVYENGVNNSNDHGIYIPSQRAVIRGNACFRNAAFGIHLYITPQYCSVYNNISFENGAAGLLDSGNNNTWAYNVCTRNKEAALSLFRSGCSYNTFVNNLFFSNVNCQIEMDSAGTTAYPHNNTIDYNDIYPTTNWATSLIQSWCGSHQLFANPLVADSTNNNYQLQSGSPCLGRATSVSLVGAPAQSNLGIFPATAYTNPF